MVDILSSYAPKNCSTGLNWPELAEVFSFFIGHPVRMIATEDKDREQANILQLALDVPLSLSSL